MELSLANSIAWDTWRLNHLRAVEMNMYALGADDPTCETDGNDPELHTAISAALTFSNESKKFALMSLYEQRMNRSLHKNLATLRDLQAERKATQKQDLEDEITLARANDLNGQPYQAPSQPTENGSVFSNSEIFRAANRLTTLTAARTTLNQSKPRVQFASASSSWPQTDAA